MRYRSDMLVDDGLDGGHRLIFQSLELIMFSIAVSFAHFAHQGTRLFSTINNFSSSY